MRIKELAELTGVTVRTLRYYDEIGLLKPSKITEVGYRLYDEASLTILQQILFFRELDFPLEQIKEIMNHDCFDQTEALKKHKELLTQKRQRLDDLIRLVNQRIKGEKTMSFKEFDTTEIETTKKQYADEVKERWGKTDAFAESQQKTSNYDKTQWNALSRNGDEILKSFAEQKDKDSSDEIVQSLVKQWQSYITEHFYTCTKDILASLGMMYVSDARFQKNIDQHGAGTAAFLSKAIEFYCSK